MSRLAPIALLIALVVAGLAATSAPAEMQLPGQEVSAASRQ